MTHDAPHLIYFADPMCSWCWGFSPVIEAVSERYREQLPMRLILGGLRPGAREAMDDAARAGTRTHWEHVRDASGQPFDFSFFERRSFVYDTEPASRAVVLARRDGPARALAYLRRAHAAFYAENRDVTAPAVLADLAAELGFDREKFLAELGSEEITREARQDFATAHRAGVTAFPTLIAGTGSDGVYELVTRGFQPAARIIAVLDAWLARRDAADQRV